MKYLLSLIILLCPVNHLLPAEIMNMWGYAYMKTSENGIAFIKKFEGFRAALYQDGSGVKTIGYGHALLPGEHMSVITEAQGEALLREDLQKAEMCIHKLIDYPLTQNQFDALASFVFNIGCHAFSYSNVYRYLKDKSFSDAVTYWGKWTHNAYGFSTLGLTNRRKQEISLFNT